MIYISCKTERFASIREEEHILESERNQRQRCNGAKQKNMDADLGVGSSAALFPFDFQTAVSTASEDVAAECAGGEEQKPKIALTFDDGPNIKYTPMLLDGLKERGIKATFF